MRHAILTCKNHPNLRWSCKEIAVTPQGNEGQGSYNGCRNIFFGGELRKGAAGQPIWYEDGSGVYSDTYIEERDSIGKVSNIRIIRECDCSSRDLILAPEDPRVWED